MWKKDDAKPQGVSDGSAAVNSPPAASAIPSSSQSISSTPPISPRAAACISQGIRIKGEVTGSEDLFVDGLVEGKLNLSNGSLTIGPNGSVKADVNAREVIVRGKVEGKVMGRDKVQLWSTGQVIGEVQTERLGIEEGAMLRGRVETGKPLSRAAETKAAAATSTHKAPETIPLNSGTAAD
jgi:cytoskeletal protein CcmA (bactofilin family)